MKNKVISQGNKVVLERQDQQDHVLRVNKENHEPNPGHLDPVPATILRQVDTEYRLFPYGTTWINLVRHRLYTRSKFHDELEPWLIPACKITNVH